MPQLAAPCSAWLLMQPWPQVWSWLLLGSEEHILPVPICCYTRQFWLAGQGREWSVPAILSPRQRSHPSMWTDQDLYFLQESMREGTLPVKDRGRPLT